MTSPTPQPTAPRGFHAIAGAPTGRLVLWIATASILVAVAVTPASAEPKPASDGIVLNNAGAGATDTLRYTFKKGAQATWSLAINTDMKIGSMPAMVMPQVVFQSTITVKRVDKNGSAHCAFSLDTTKVKPAGKLKATALAAINKKLAGLKGVGGTATFDQRGRLLSYKRKPLAKKGTPPSKDDAPLEVLLLNFDQAFSQAAIPLPAEPVGKGATWTVDRKVLSNAISLRQKATYKLLKRGAAGGVHRFEVKVTQSAKPQNIKLPGMPSTLKTKLLRADGSGTSTLTIHADRIGTDGKSATTLDLAIEMKQGDQSGKAGVKLNSSLAFKRTVKP